MDFLFVSWDQLHDYCFQLTKKIHQSGLKLDRIICISRGGLVVARILSDFLNLPISSFTIVAYDSIAKIKQPRIVEKLKINIKNQNILLVDEIIDSGATLKIALQYIKSLSPQKAISIAPVIKPKSFPLPDYWLIKTDKWVVFPYELRETMNDLEKMHQLSILKSSGFHSDHLQYFSNCNSKEQSLT